jgi:hypothetical protein
VHVADCSRRIGRRVLAHSIREARALAAQARAAARGRGAQAKLRSARRLEELAGRCQRIVVQIQQRSRGEKISDRLVSVSDPDEFGYVVQVAEVTANTGRGALGFLLPAASAPGNPGENRLLEQTAAELDRLGLRPREVALDGEFVPGPTGRPWHGWRRRGRSSLGGPSRAPGAPAGGWPATALAVRAASATSSATGSDAAA